MSAQVQIAAESAYSPRQTMPERAAWYLPGVPMLVLDLAALAAAIAALWQASVHKGDAAVALAWLGVVLVVATILVWHGLTPVVPGRAHIVQLFGRYQGTIREPGLQWVNPFTNRIAVSTRIRNLESALAKVNDADGNPI